MVTIEELSFEAEGVALNCARAGSGAPVLVLHGGSARWQHLQHLVEALAEHWEVFAPDLRGHGRSTHTPGRYRLVDYADDVIALLEQTGAARAFGHSLGGQVAVVAAARRPDLFRALAVGDTPLTTASLRRLLPPSRPMLAVWRELAASDDNAEQIARVLRGQQVEFEARSGRAEDLMSPDSSWFEFMAGCLRDLDPTMLDAVIEFDAMHAGFEVDRLLPAIRCPLLLVQADPRHGGALSDEEVARAQAVRPGTRVVRIQGAGHSVYPWKIEAVLRDFFADDGRDAPRADA